MRHAEQRDEKLQEVLCANKIATLPELKEALGTNSTMTVFRALSSTGYLTSYSHRGGYYTLPCIPDFDMSGLWTFDAVGFSRHGNLLDTVKALVETSGDGRAVSELDVALQVETKHAALRLFRLGKLDRSVVDGVFVYLSVEAATRRRQELTRHHRVELHSLGAGMTANLQRDELKAAVILFFSLLDERQRRLYAGLESLRMGHGGDQLLAELLDMDPHTVAKGRRELIEGSVPSGRMRTEGGGRPRTEKKSPG